MNSLIQYLSPKNEDGSVDQRYSDQTKRLIEKLGTKGTEAVNSLMNGQLALAKKHGWVGMVICDYVYEISDEMDRKENHPHRWKQKKYRKSVQQLLEGIGLTSSQAKFIVKAKLFTEKLKFEAYKGNRPKVTLLNQLEFIRSYGPRGQYLLSKMNTAGLNQAIKDAKRKGNLLTVNELDGLKNLYPSNPEENRGRRRKKALELAVCSDDNNSLNEILIEGDEVDALIAAVRNVDIEVVMTDDEKMARLQAVARELDCLAYYAKPKPVKPVYV